MKSIKALCFSSLVVALAGCATRQPIVVEQPVGPDLAHPRINVSQGHGQLVVYSAPETAADPLNSDFPTHTSYDIYDADGNFVRHVDNRSGTFYDQPKAVSLPTGKYQVKAQATNHGLVTVPVIIREAETTTLDLDATHFRQHKPTGAGQWVRLPSGEVIGMREP